MKTHCASSESLPSSLSDDGDSQDQLQGLGSQLMQAVSTLLDGNIQDVVLLLMQFIKQIERSLLHRIRVEKQQRQESIGQVEDFLNTWLDKGCHQPESIPKVAIPQSTRHLAKQFSPTSRALSLASPTQQVPASDEINFKKQVTIEPHKQTCPQPTVKADAADKPCTARLAMHPCIQSLSSSSSTNSPGPIKRPSIKSAQTVSNLPLWLRPRSNELREYEKRVGDEQRVGDEKQMGDEKRKGERASTGEGNLLNTLHRT